MRGHYYFILLFILGCIVRIVTISYALEYRENTDILRYKDWAQIAFIHSFSDTYTHPEYLSFGTYANNLPPLFLYCLWLMYMIWIQIGKVLFAVFGILPGSNTWINGPFLTVLFRIPSFISDCIISVFLYLSVLRLTKHRGRSLLGALLFLFNPSVIYNSAFWGQMDSVNNVFFILSLYFFISKKFILSSLFYLYSLFVKLSLIIFAPFFVLFLFIKKFSVKKWIVLLFLVLLSVIVITLPITTDIFTWYAHFIRAHGSGEMNNITAFAFNVWWVVFQPTIVFGNGPDLFSLSSVSLEHSPEINTILFSLSLQQIAMFFYGLFIFPIYFFIYKKRKLVNNHTLFTFMSVIAFTGIALLSYLFLPKMHERYLYPVYIPLILTASLGVSLYYELILLTLLNFINLVIVWHPMALPDMWYSLMRSHTFQQSIAICTVVIGFWIYYKLLRTLIRL